MCHRVYIERGSNKFWCGGGKKYNILRAGCK